ncbi:hypothetical protein HWC53_gp089 [Bacillus phage vB_BmeM-Goe8]|uniref:Uncharacterized protein n=1 Tax=Bacillus phage vB_BmeM-Goe8 TaxID=2593638 RepID=A0A516KN35_9CAUD|nr:hypothetical protein HWC53_gp089 [Bacillus phage vB_BmeM-Goe8]QDP43000.1 hypothetical protein Goe8_c02270 [Bacillus phage vB_BmeM-Goe8]
MDFDINGNPIPKEPLHKRLKWQELTCDMALRAWATDNKHIKSVNVYNGRLRFHPKHNPLYLERYEFTDCKWYVDVTPKEGE